MYISQIYLSLYLSHLPYPTLSIFLCLCTSLYMWKLHCLPPNWTITAILIINQGFSHAVELSLTVDKGAPLGSTPGYSCIRIFAIIQEMMCLINHFFQVIQRGLYTRTVISVISEHAMT
jgi:hypothetical protein